MKFTLKDPAGQSYDTYAYTGGKPFDADKPTLIFIHGVLNDHSVWILQTRYLAHMGSTSWRWIYLATDAAQVRPPPVSKSPLTSLKR